MKLNRKETKTLMAIFMELERVNSLGLKNRWGTKMVDNIWSMYDSVTKAYESYALGEIANDEEVEI